MIKFKQGDQKIAINNHIVPLPGPIWSVFEYKNYVLVTLEQKFARRNVFCFNEHGEQLWIIEKDDFFKFGDDGYDGVAIREEKEGQLLAYGRGRPFLLDINTGKVETIPGSFER